MLERNLNLIRKIVWEYTKKHSHLEFDDLFSEACVACLEAEKIYDEEKGAETSFVWTIVNNRLKTILFQEIIRNNNLPLAKYSYIENIEDSAPGPEQQIINEENWNGFKARLSEDGKRICDILFNDLTVYLPIEKPKKCKGIIKKKLIENGWEQRRVTQRFKELREALL